MSLCGIDDVRRIEFPQKRDETGILAVMEAGVHVPMHIKRVFVVSGHEGVVRGRHAHKLCNQIYACLHGTCRVKVMDGEREEMFELSAFGGGLLIPQSIWAEQTYIDPDTVLMVLCDRPYEPEDYIRDYGEFLAYRGRVARA